MNTKTKHILSAAYLLISAIFLMNSCQSTKEIVQVSLPEKSKNERLDILVSQALQYETFSSSLRFTAKLGEKSKSISTTGQLKMTKGKAIQIVLKDHILGIMEAFRITITPDIIIIVDRVNKRYLAEPMAEIQSEAPFDFNFYSFQALLSNQLFIAGKEEVTPNDYTSYHIQEDQFLSHIKSTDSHNMEYYFQSDYTNRILKTQIYKKEWESGIQWNYEEFGLTDNKKLFPMSMNMKLSMPEDTVYLDFSLNNVTIDKRLDIDTNFPAKYRKVSLQEMMKLIKSL